MGLKNKSYAAAVRQKVADDGIRWLFASTTQRAVSNIPMIIRWSRVDMASHTGTK
ncbi:hypothetical protein PY32053_04692 (plasmid) [Paracoccus yeei]|uniref:Uncharacterized protein n=1 Tax=Paracoccus yeei TaxID=147645 RepID=A0A386UU76_9RHOB|nr:hypothetical protein PY32053_04692 [Paracoccus yeei]